MGIGWFVMLVRGGDITSDRCISTREDCMSQTRCMALLATPCSISRCLRLNRTIPFGLREHRMVSSNSTNSDTHPLIRAAFEKAKIDPSSSDRSEYFTKTSRIVPQLVGEYKSLEALSQMAPPGFVPRPYGLAVSEDGKEGGMVSERFVFGGTKDQKELGRRLAEMHKYTSPNGKFGFGVPTFCGVTEQDNTWTEGWKEFFVERRVGDMVKRIGDKEISKEWEKMRDK